MPQKNELLITGVPFTLQEYAEVQSLVNDSSVKVHALETKSATTQLVQLIFNDFNAVAFVRDLVISSILTASYAKLKAVAQHLLRKGRPVENICIEKDLFTEDRVPFRLYIAARADQVEQLITALDAIPKDKLMPLTKNSLVMVRYDEKGDIEIAIM